MLNDLLDGPLALCVTIKKAVLRQRQQERSCRLKVRLQVIEDQSVVRQQFNVSLDVWDVLVFVRFFDSSHCSLARRRQGSCSHSVLCFSRFRLFYESTTIG